MKVVWNSCKRELGGIKSAYATETTANSSFEILR